MFSLAMYAKVYQVFVECELSYFITILIFFTQLLLHIDSDNITNICYNDHVKFKEKYIQWHEVAVALESEEIRSQPEVVQRLKYIEVSLIS